MSRVPPPGPSFVGEQEILLGEQGCRAGIDSPTLIEGWWLSVLWIADDEGVVPCRRMAPLAGPPPDPPIARLGPFLSGGLSGWILEEEGRQQLRVRLPLPPEDPARAWTAPLVVQVALRWEPARAAGATSDALARVALGAFRSAVEAVHRP